MTKRGLPAPNLDYRAGDPNLLNGGYQVEPQTSPFQIPGGPDKEAIEARQAARGELWETLDHANWPASRIEEALDRLFPDLRSPERVEELEVRGITQGLRSATKAEKTKRKYRSTRSPRDKGAPPHIAKEIRGDTA